MHLVPGTVHLRPAHPCRAEPSKFVDFRILKPTIVGGPKRRNGRKWQFSSSIGRIVIAHTQMATFIDFCVRLKFWHAVQFFKPNGATFSAILKILQCIYHDRHWLRWYLRLKFSPSLNSAKFFHPWTDTNQEKLNSSHIADMFVSGMYLAYTCGMRYYKNLDSFNLSGNDVS
jgi:hypothetical protein